MTLRFEVLGPLRVRRDGLELRGTAQRSALLGVLLLAGDTPVRWQQLYAAGWDGSGQPSRTVQVAVHRLRQWLGAPGIITSTGDGYRLVRTAYRTDADDFRALAAESRFGDALALWRGPVLGGLLPASPAATALRHARRDALCDFVASCRARGEPAEALPELNRATAEDPYDEEMHALLALALGDSGRPDQAFELIEQLRERLSERFGTAPGKPVRDALRHLSEGAEPAYDDRARLLLNRMSVFPGVVDAGTAASVCGFAPITAYDVLELLPVLTTSGALTRDRGGFRLLPQVRAAAGRGLAESAEERAVHEASLSHWLSEAAAGRPIRRDAAVEAITNGFRLGCADASTRLSVLVTALWRHDEPKETGIARLTATRRWWPVCHPSTREAARIALSRP